MSNGGTLNDWVQAMVESFQALSPAEQARVRREIWEKMTGKTFRPN